MHQPKLQGFFLTRIGYVLFCGTTNPIFLDRLMVVLYKTRNGDLLYLLLIGTYRCGLVASEKARGTFATYEDSQ
jgi:hypothetical protein